MKNNETKNWFFKKLFTIWSKMTILIFSILILTCWILEYSIFENSFYLLQNFPRSKLNVNGPFKFSCYSKCSESSQFCILHTYHTPFYLFFFKFNFPALSKELYLKMWPYKSTLTSLACRLRLHWSSEYTHLCS